MHTYIHTCIQHNLPIHNLLVLTLPHTTCSTPIRHHLFSLSCFPHAIFTFLLLLVGRKLTCGVIRSFNFQLMGLPIHPHKATGQPIQPHIAAGHPSQHTKRPAGKFSHAQRPAGRRVWLQRGRFSHAERPAGRCSHPKPRGGSGRPADSAMRDGGPGSRPAGRFSHSTQLAGRPIQPLDPTGRPADAATRSNRPAGRFSHSTQPAGRFSHSTQPAGRFSHSTQAAGRPISNFSPDCTTSRKKGERLRPSKAAARVLRVLRPAQNVPRGSFEAQ